jgi:hypothetical protein
MRNETFLQLDKPVFERSSAIMQFAKLFATPFRDTPRLVQTSSDRENVIQARLQNHLRHLWPRASDVISFLIAMSNLTSLLGLELYPGPTCRQSPWSWQSSVRLEFVGVTMAGTDSTSRLQMAFMDI